MQEVRGKGRGGEGELNVLVLSVYYAYYAYNYVYIPTYVHVRIYYVRMLCIIIDNVIIRSCSHTVRCLSMEVVVVTLVREYGTAVQFAAIDD